MFFSFSEHRKFKDFLNSNFFHANQNPDIVKKHKCHLCNYSTNNAKHLEMHSVTHSGVRPFPCPHCEKSFTQKGNLHRHITSHFKIV